MPPDSDPARLPPRPTPPGRSRAGIDLGIVLAATLACWGIASALQWQEALSQGLARFERWQADELPLALLVLACGMAWYAWRRRREVQRELDLRTLAETRVGDLLAHNRELAQQLLTLQEDERKALARELHDEFGQNCTSIRIETAYLRHCAAGDRAGMLAAAERADAAARELQDMMRDMLRRLRPPNLDMLGLAATLQELCEAWRERTGVGCAFVVRGDTTALGDAVDMTVYRVTQEALTNVTRHARARGVRVELARVEPQSLVLEIQDDGRGLDAGRPARGLGLLGAAERAAAVGGTLDVEGTPGAGVRITLRIPVAAPQRLAA